MQQFIAAIAFVIVFSSCADKSKNDITVFRATEEGLQQSIQTISISNELIYRSLEERLADSVNRYHREYSYHREYILKWQAKALQVKTYSDNMARYIQGIKEELINEAGPNDPGEKGLFKEDNLTVTDHVFNSHGRGKELFEKLAKYRQDVLGVDSVLNHVFESTITIFAKGFTFSQGYEEFTKTFFGKIPLIAAMAMLSKFENNVRVNENRIISFCHSKTYPVMIIDDFPEALITQSTNYVKAGEEIEITAGIGIYSAAVQPKVVINGKDIALNDDPRAIYKLKASMKPGKYYVPVKIEFMRPDGTKAVMEKDIVYTVIEEK